MTSDLFTSNENFCSLVLCGISVYQTEMWKLQGLFQTNAK